MRNLSDAIVDPENLAKELKKVRKFTVVMCLVIALYSTLLAVGLYFAYDYHMQLNCPIGNNTNIGGL